MDWGVQIYTLGQLIVPLSAVRNVYGHPRRQHAAALMNATTAETAGSRELHVCFVSTVSGS